MKKEKAIDVLNSLITINNDRIEGYETASNETEEQDLKTLFAQFMATSKKCKQELVMEVTTLGGEVAEGTKTSGKFFRVWMDVKAALTGKDRKAILNSCEFGEDKAQDTYEKALENDSDYLSAEQQSMVYEQKAQLKADHDHIKALRDALED
ncbi:MAG: PA2169 family four-helix-bundle protein [Bacteroidales bacterium]